MSGRNERETDEHAPPDHALDGVRRRRLCASVVVDARSFVIELPPGMSVVVGRDADADLQLGTGSVSRQHARLDVRADHCTVTDLGSRNGTYVNGERLVAGPRRVGRGDELWFGSARLALVGGTLVPTDVRAILLRPGLFARIDADIAAGRDLHGLALRLPERWNAGDDVTAWMATIAADAYVGLVTENIIVVISSETIDLTVATASVGRSSTAESGAKTGAELVTGAVRSLSAVGPARAEGTGAPIFVCEAMRQVQDEAVQIAPSNVSVLLIGETGVGKEVFARLIHERSGRTGSLVSVNTAAIPEALVESTLFGHERGAFSGAHQAKAGLFEAAQGGTLFLDEIGDLPLALQAKLLRVLEERSVRRVGATDEKKIDVRVIAATHADLERAVDEGTFRQDLYFRLNACTLRIPPLRDRVAEIERLAVEFLAHARGASGPRLALSPAAGVLLVRYPWPGNVRELRNVMERGAAIAGSSSELLAEHLPQHVRSPSGVKTASERIVAPQPDDVRDALKEYERRRVLDALDRTDGNRTEAAKLLGLPRRTFTYKMTKLGIGRG